MSFPAGSRRILQNKQLGSSLSLGMVEAHEFGSELRESRESREEHSFPSRNVQAPTHVHLALRLQCSGPDVFVSGIGGDMELVDHSHAARQVAGGFDLDVVLGGGSTESRIER